MLWSCGRTLIAMVTTVAFLAGSAPALAADTIRAGLQASGTFSWIIRAIDYFGIDEQVGLNIEATTYATKQATELALMAGEVDVTVDDFVNVVLMRSNGVPVKAVYPYSLALGGLVVRADSDIRSVADLRGRVIGASSMSDKSLLVLRALAKAKYGFDPQFDSQTISAAPPLMTQLLLRGEMDAALPFWHFVARMVGSGEFREVISVHEMLRELGMSSELPNLIILAHDGADRQAVAKFLRAMDMAVARMKTDDGIWEIILDEGLYSLPDPSLMAAVRQRWELSLPSQWNSEIVRGLVELVEQLVAVAGSDLVGIERLDPDAYSTEFAF
ncbi:MAG: ABC transporter substrate-binding protein [Firmicutes bacterium]|nr:ABC transporter substrate-binding protein [Bacillota bacterium]